MAVRLVQDITFDVTGQKVYFDAPEGRPSSVTSATVFGWDVSDDDTAESAIGTPTVDADPDVVIAADSGYGQSDARILNVDDSADFVVGRTYLVTSVAGAHESFICAEVGDDTVTAQHPLHNAYTADDAVQSTRITATVDPSWVADEANLRDDAGPNPHYRVRWVYVLADDSVRVVDTYFNLVRYAGTHGVLPQDVEAMSPGWLDRLPSDHRNTQGRALIDEAYREVRMDVHQIDIAASSLAESEIVDGLVKYKTIELGEYARVLAGGGSSEAVMLSQKRYQERLDALLRIVSRIPVRDTTGAAAPVVAVGLSRR